jgi:hypothetical protein
MPQLTDDGRRLVEDIASRHHVSTDAAIALLSALAAGHGSQAQFSHPELGGMGQWSRGGMIMVGDMFNNALKTRVDALCTELSAWIERTQPFAALAQAQSQSQGQPGVSLFVPGRSTAWWHPDLGTPASVAAQNDLRYAYFPGTRRPALDLGGRISVFDTGEHQISGFSQQQGSDQTITFTSQLGLVRVTDLPQVTLDVAHAASAAQEASPAQEAEVRAEDKGTRTSAPTGEREPLERPEQGSASADDIFAKVERLAELRRKDILTEEEYASKKAELLARL